MSKRTKKTNTKNKPTVEVEVMPPNGMSERALVRKLDHLQRMHLEGRLPTVEARLQIQIFSQLLQVMALPHKQAELACRQAAVELEKVKFLSREAGRTRQRERDVGLMDADTRSTVKRRLMVTNGAETEH